MQTRLGGNGVPRCEIRAIRLGENGVDRLSASWSRSDIRCQDDHSRDAKIHESKWLCRDAEKGKELQYSLLWHQARDLEDHNVRVIFRKLPSETSPISNLMVNSFGSFAAFERELIIDHTRRGRRHT
jgi:hypothetical protein